MNLNKTRNKPSKGIELTKYKNTELEEDYNFDFSIYEREEKEEKIINSVSDLKKTKPSITNLRSKYGSSIQEIESLLSLKQSISEYGIRVASNTEDSGDLWKFYGCLNEYWARIKDVFGKKINEDIIKQKNYCEHILKKYANKNIQNFEVNKKLLELRDDIYMLAQRVNLGIEVEKIYSSKSKAKSGIIE